jgi:DNA mismatch endonuclease (patch repair protein)
MATSRHHCSYEREQSVQLEPPSLHDSMVDIWCPAKRSEVMGRVRAKGNRSTELRLIGIFRELGITGWRRNQDLPGKPDFVFRARKVCVFVDGCFWHGCPQCYRRPASRQDYWDAKVKHNRDRDRKVNRDLHARGWLTLRVWEHQLCLAGRKNLVRRLRRLGLLPVSD